MVESVLTGKANGCIFPFVVYLGCDPKQCATAENGEQFGDVRSAEKCMQSQQQLAVMLCQAEEEKGFVPSWAVY